MIQLRGGLGLAAEAVDERIVTRELGLEDS